MKRALASVIAAGIATAALSSVSFAGPNANANIMLHVLLKTTKNACTRTTPAQGGTVRPVCVNAVTEAPTGAGIYYFTHVLVTNGSAAGGVAGVQFGIQYGSGATDGVGIDVFGWTLCAKLEFPQPTPSWPNNGGGTLVTWDASSVDPQTGCQIAEPGGLGTGVVANAGYFYMSAYSPGTHTFQITPRPIDGQAKVAACTAEEDVIPPQHLGNAVFSPGGTAPGYNPCDPVPTINTTWSKIKTTYGS
jgi:hypothetical protein